MIAIWMLYATAFGSLMSVAAAALDRLAPSARVPRRWLWLGAIVTTLAAPALLALRRPPARPSALANDARAGSAGVVGAGGPSAPAGARAGHPDLSRLDMPLLVGWAFTSGMVALTLMGASLAQRRSSRHWATRVVGDTTVRVAPDVGPLVFGLWRLEIVLPAWALLRSDVERRMMLAHEEEHRRARDPNVLLLGVIVVAASPWNLGLWWQLRKLRLAIETDCDRRVLGAGVDVHGYGTLLINVGSFSSAPARLAATAFAEAPSLLERRIDAMTAPVPRHPVARAVSLGAVAAGALLLACASPSPAPVRTAAAPEPTFPLARQVSGGEPGFSREQMTSTIRRYFPDVLRGDTTGGLPLRFLLDAQGRIVSTSRGGTSGAAIAVGRIAFAHVENAPAGYYGPTPIRVEATWLKPDSVADTARPFGLTVTTIGRPTDTSTVGTSFEEEARGWLGARPDLVRGVGSADTAYVWFVLDASRQPTRAGRATSVSMAAHDAGAEGNLGLMGYRESFKPGVLAAGTVIVVAWSRR